VVICLEQGADLHMAQLMQMPLTVSCFSKIQTGLPFWYRLTWVVPEKGPLNGCVCVCVCVCVSLSCISCQKRCTHRQFGSWTLASQSAECRLTQRSSQLSTRNVSRDAEALPARQPHNQYLRVYWRMSASVVSRLVFIQHRAKRRTTLKGAISATAVGLGQSIKLANNSADVTRNNTEKYQS